jgi:hypothetical protein
LALERVSGLPFLSPYGHAVKHNLPGRVTRLLRMERGEGRGLGSVGPGRRRRLAAGRAEPDHDQDVVLGVRNVTFDGAGTIEIATIRYSPIYRIESNRESIDNRTILW